MKTFKQFREEINKPSIGAARGIKKFIKNRPNTSKFEIQQDAREVN